MRRRHGGTSLLATLVVLGTGAFARTPAPALAQGCERPCVGPRRGVLIAAGGGELDAAIYRRFVRLAGGPEARLVLIPTAGTEEGGHDAWTALEALRDAGALRIEVLHTRNRAVADLEAFASPLADATGVWMSGGHQWRLVDAYLDTRTHRELARVLERGGVVGGNSAGASALASFLIRGSREGNHLVMAPGHDRGFGFLRNAAVDQHLLTRARENDLVRVLAEHPNLIGIGLDEGAAVVVGGDLAEVIGRSRVAIYDVTDPLMLVPIRWLSPGEVYDLGQRHVVLGELAEPALPGPPS